MNRTRLVVFVAVIAAHLLALEGLILASSLRPKAIEDQGQIMELAEVPKLPEEKDEPKLAEAPPSPPPAQETIDPGEDSPDDEPNPGPTDATPAPAPIDDDSTFASTGGVPGGTGKVAGAPLSDDDYVPMQKISQLPVIAESSVRSHLAYPETARKAGIEGVVYLELFIDSIGKIQKIYVLKETPGGFGFADAAIKAFQGCTCVPAQANGISVSVRYRYPIRFSLN
jgi:periplasmic protein TonB